MQQGCLFTEVFKVLYLSADTALVNLTVDTKMDIENKTVLGRKWLSLKEYYAAMFIVRRCERYKVPPPSARPCRVDLFKTKYNIELF